MFPQSHGILQQRDDGLSVTVNAENQSVVMANGNPWGLLNNQFAFSISLWWKPSDVTNTGNFFSNLLGSSPFRGIALANTGGAGTEFALFYIDDAFPGEAIEIRFAASPVNNQWNNIIFTYDGSQLAAGCEVYLNGVATSKTVNNDSLAGSNGAITTDDFEFFNGNFLGNALQGEFDEISIWDIELNSSQVSEIYNSGSAGNLNLVSFSGNRVSWYQIDNDVASFPTFQDTDNTADGTYTNIPVGNLTDDTP
jgi:hypothetical protein